MIYLDNAATTRIKPKEVVEAYMYYLNEIGVSPGRGSYSLGVEASRMLYKARVSVANFFGLQQSNVIFTKNSTEAINVFFRGFLKKGDHIVISPYEHNAVYRPICKMAEEGIVDYSIIRREDLTLPADEIVEKYFNSRTRIIAMTLASNLTGRVIFRRDLFAMAHSKGVETFVDASQGAANVRVYMCDEHIDYLAFTGHKDLKGLPGVGGLCSIKPLDFGPLIQGGTGVHGHEKTNPMIYPEGYEAGTLNMPAIWALKKAVEMINENETEKINELVKYLLSALSELDGVTVYDKEFARVETVGFNVKGLSSNEVVGILDKEGICTRGGIHCAILAHEALNTTECGIVRVSLSGENTIEEINRLITVLKGIN